MINLLVTRILFCCTSLMLSACSSIMTHAGPADGYYPGSKNSLERIKDENTGWVLRPLLVIDLPLTAVMDTLFIPLDYVRSGDSSKEDSPKKRIDSLEKQAKDETQHNKSDTKNTNEQ
ncbi:YceK/YidQ family lipoprotein [Providencia sneebia]|nr:YceK/YidQ family lipoprotein [Providencia sneebia]